MNSQNSSPSADGDITPYVGAVAGKSSSWQTRQAVFVNGIQNTASDHKAASTAVSDAIEGRVLGVYNQMRQYKFTSFVDYVKQQRQSIPDWMDSIKPADCSSNALIKDKVSLAKAGAVLKDIGCAFEAAGGALLAVGHDLVVAPGTKAILIALETALKGIDWAQSIGTDVGQCGLDILNLMTTRLVNSPVQVLGCKFPDAFRNIIFGYFRMVNPAVGALLDLIGTQKWTTGRCGIVAHSQGNLITACALSALECLNQGTCQPPKFKGGMQVFAVASPASRWPNCGAIIRCYTHAYDPVAALSGGRSQWQNNAGKEAGGVVIESGGSHGFATYLTANGTLHKELRQWYLLKGPLA